MSDLKTNSLLSKRLIRLGWRLAYSVAWLMTAVLCSAETTNSAVVPISTPSIPDAGLSLMRVTGALALVLGLFLGGVWLFRNWQRLAVHRGRAPKLRVLETRSLGGRQALYVVGYEQERLLIASSAAGVQLISQLSPADEEEPTTAAASATFADALATVLKGK